MFLRELLRKLKSFILPPKPKTYQIIRFDEVPSGLLPQSVVFDYYTFTLYDKQTKERIYWEMYNSSAIIHSAVNFIVSSINSFEIYFKTEIPGLDEIVESLHQYINLEKIIRDITRDTIVQGYSYHLITHNNNNIELVRCNHTNIEEIKDEAIKVFQQYYAKSEFIIVELPNSPLLPIIPLYNIIRKTEDSLYLNLEKFGIPFIKVKTKSHLSEQTKEFIKQKLKDFYSGNKEITIPVMFLETDKIDLEFYTPENMIDQYIKVLSFYEKLVHKVLGILPTLTSDTSGSYAKTKAQADLYFQILENNLKYILSEIRNKLLPKLLIFFGYDKIVEENDIETLGYYAIVRKAIEQEKLKQMITEVEKLKQEISEVKDNEWKSK